MNTRIFCNKKVGQSCCKHMPTIKCLLSLNYFCKRHSKNIETYTENDDTIKQERTVRRMIKEINSFYNQMMDFYDDIDFVVYCYKKMIFERNINEIFATISNENEKIIDEDNSCLVCLNGLGKDVEKCCPTCDINIHSNCSKLWREINIHCMICKNLFS